MFSRYGMTLPGFREISTAPYWKAQGNRVIEVANITSFLRMYRGADFGKTGYTRNAGSTLAAGAWRDGHRLFAVDPQLALARLGRHRPASTGPSPTTMAATLSRRIVWLLGRRRRGGAARCVRRQLVPVAREDAAGAGEQRRTPHPPPTPSRCRPTRAIAPQPAAPPKAANAKKVVVLDPGHGGDEVGSARNGVVEKQSNLEMAFRVEKLLTDAGYDVVLTRREDTRAAYAPKGFTPTYWDLQARADIANAAHGDVFVSIHSNGSDDTSQRGVETWYDSKRARRTAEPAAREADERARPVGAAQLRLHGDGPRSAGRQLLPPAQRPLLHAVHHRRRPRDDASDRDRTRRRPGGGGLQRRALDLEPPDRRCRRRW